MMLFFLAGLWDPSRDDGIGVPTVSRWDWYSGNRPASCQPVRSSTLGRVLARPKRQGTAPGCFIQRPVAFPQRPVSQYVLQPEGLSYLSQAMCMVLAGVQHHVRFRCLHNLKMTYSAKARVLPNPILLFTDETWSCYQFSLPHLHISHWKVGVCSVLFELGNERVKVLKNFTDPIYNWFALLNKVMTWPGSTWKLLQCTVNRLWLILCNYFAQFPFRSLWCPALVFGKGNFNVASSLLNRITPTTGRAGICEQRGHQNPNEN